jgi:hypothetical protein
VEQVLQLEPLALELVQLELPQVLVQPQAPLVRQVQDLEQLGPLVRQELALDLGPLVQERAWVRQLALDWEPA